MRIILPNSYKLMFKKKKNTSEKVKDEYLKKKTSEKVKDELIMVILD